MTIRLRTRSNYLRRRKHSKRELRLKLKVLPKLDLADKIQILPASSGNFKNFIHKKFSGRIAYCTILNLNTLLNKSVNFPPLVGKIRILPARSTFECDCDPSPISKMLLAPCMRQLPVDKSASVLRSSESQNNA